MKSAAYSVSRIAEGAIPTALAEELDVLGANAVESNVFYEAWMLGHALTAMPINAPAFVTVRSRTGELTGFFPFEVVRGFRGLPIRTLRLWRHLHCFLCTPLVSRQHARETVAALFDWMESPAAPAKLMELDRVSSDGPFAQLLDEERNRRPHWECHVSTYQRALLHPITATPNGVSGKHRKELRRLERRLAELGRLEYRVLGNEEPARLWIERFLELESRGWKGRMGTALASREREMEFFSLIAEDGARRGQMQMLALELDGSPIAMKCNFRTRDCMFAFKIAFDEEYGKFSPGVLLELFNMELLADGNPPIAWMDSCAIAEHFMINRLWSDRRSIGSFVLAGRGLVGRTLIRHATTLRNVTRSLRGWRQRR